jgi:hypothetical protein
MREHARCNQTPQSDEVAGNMAEIATPPRLAERLGTTLASGFDDHALERVDRPQLKELLA